MEWFKIFAMKILTIVTLSTFFSNVYLCANAIRTYPENPEEVFGERNKIICVTCPKAGTHLLIKCLELLQIDDVHFRFDEPIISKKRKPKPYSHITLEHFSDRAFSRLINRIEEEKHLRKGFLVHLPYHEKFLPFFNDFTTKNFLMIRHPCAQLTSLATTALPNPSERNGDLSKILLDLIQGTENFIPFQKRHGSSDLVWSVNVVDFFNSFLRWNQEPNFLVVRFEDLVGPQGGGSSELQLETILKIAEHLGVNPTQEHLKFIMENLFGESRTFNRGQVDSWKQYFTPEVIEAFKAIPGTNELLEAMGYQKFD